MQNNKKKICMSAQNIRRPHTQTKHKAFSEEKLGPAHHDKKLLINATLVP